MDISDSEIQLLAETVRWRGRDEVRIVGANVGHVYVPINAPFYSGGDAQKIVRNQVRAVIYADRALRERVELGLTLKRKIADLMRQAEKDRAAHAQSLNEADGPISSAQKDLTKASDIINAALDGPFSLADERHVERLYNAMVRAHYLLKPHRVVEF